MDWTKKDLENPHDFDFVGTGDSSGKNGTDDEEDQWSNGTEDSDDVDGTGTGGKGGSGGSAGSKGATKLRALLSFTAKEVSHEKEHQKSITDHLQEC